MAANSATAPASPVMKLRRWLIVAMAAGLVSVTPALAHHPGEGLDKELVDRELYFQAIDRPAPAFRLATAEGAPVALQDFSDKVVVLHFVYASCPDVCPLHAEKIAEVQELIDATPMRDRVQFLTVTTDPANDTAEVLQAYGPDHGLDPANWTFLTIRPGQDEAATRDLAQSFGHKFTLTEDGYQAHGVVTHVIDRGGRWAANFHGLKFEPVNLVLYINGLTNNAYSPETAEPGFWGRLRNLF